MEKSIHIKNGTNPPNKTEGSVTNLITYSFIALWSYAAISKLAVLDKSRSEMMNQVFPIWMAEVLFWLIPVIEIAICALLIIGKTRLTGLYASLVLMSSFSVYIGLAMTGIFGRIPCSCGGLLDNMSYGTHLIFNLFFVILAAIGIAIATESKVFKIIIHRLKNRKEIARHSE